MSEIQCNAWNCKWNDEYVCNRSKMILEENPDKTFNCKTKEEIGNEN